MANKYKDFDRVLVCDVIMDEEHSHYKSSEDIGTILFYGLDEGNPGPSCHTCFPAKPINYNISHYPVANEVVMVAIAPKPWYHFNQEETYYYFPPIGVMNNPGANTLPNVITERGEHYMGRYYRLNEAIKPLRPYEGDIMLEGRFGNSLRFGSTSAHGQFHNAWSQVGATGNPITIIRNGQKNIMEDGETSYSHIVEDLNHDDSSIYLCSQQQMTGFERASNHEASYLVDLEGNKKQLIINQPNNTMDSSIEEDAVLKSTSNLHPAELQRLDELANIKAGNTAYYDTSPTEGQMVRSTDSVDVNNETYPSSEEDRAELDLNVGDINPAAAQDNTAVAGPDGSGTNDMGGW